ncbi:MULTISPECIES: DUF4229 domain-containing protein [Streptomyces]|uniref:DUF4229 domain-containing protein n=1 Tax=Streptomyces TaxID=1883 RepID=UPI002B05CED0|nr:DUF4229 domain-containing protein [Streptomyces sp. JHD 1]
MTSTTSPGPAGGPRATEGTTEGTGENAAARTPAAPPAAGTPAAPTAAGPGTRHAALRYTLLRLGLFAACFVVLSVLAWFGVIPAGLGRSNPLWLLALSILVSAPLSMVLLRRQREAMAQQIAPRVERVSGSVRNRLAAHRDQEDDVA